jgi:oligopeptide/dipeptide ABC transporter ATP-binding protein
MIAMAIACSPKVLIADEPATALDVMVQAQILALLRRLRADLGIAMILISHDLSVLAEACDRVMVMYAGRVAEVGSVEDVFNGPDHPYTRLLVDAFPNIRGERTIANGIPGSPPDLRVDLVGCAFRDRCSLRIAKCNSVRPEVEDVGRGHLVACHLVEPWHD